MARQLLIPQIGNADLKLLRIFKAVAECGGISAAESELNIGRSTISKQLSDLEHRLGMRLCNRGPAGFRLTDEGRPVLRAAEALLDSVRDFRTQVSEVRQKLVGTLRVAAFDQCITNPEARLSHAIRAFTDRAPGVDLELSLLSPNLIEARLHEGHLDVGIIAMHRPSPGLDYLPVHGENMFLYCGRGHPFFEVGEDGLTVEDVRRTRYAGISFNSPNLQYGQALDMRPRAVVQNEMMLAVLIMSGQYVGFMPDHMAERFEQDGRMRRVLPGEISYRTSFAAATRRVPEPNRLTRVFLGILGGLRMGDG
jgi:DNA-binding transcriptional LysR family regulator